MVLIENAHVWNGPGRGKSRLPRLPWFVFHCPLNSTSTPRS
jgi:hypothetical protein